MGFTLHDLRIRPYEPGDASATLKIFTAAITQTAAADYAPEHIQAWARPGLRNGADWNHAMLDRNSFVATANNEVVGFSDVDERGYIDMMYVDPEYGRLGIARALLAEAERQAGDFHAESVWANVSITARPFFESQGFLVERQREPSLQGVRLVNFRMRKALPGRHPLTEPT